MIAVQDVFGALEHHPFPLCEKDLFFAFRSEPAAGRTMRINPIEFAFQLLTPQGVPGGRLGQFALQLLVFGDCFGEFAFQLLTP